ncbi:uncharacterized protein LOC136768257 [Amia ocellicauda]|uniref:uncharacterized protein LOC136768257 n=1 Tax=Amia ocellicauda TaxID=2972642 RepID=UPI003463C7B0
MSGSDTEKQCPRCHGPMRVAPGGSAIVPCQSCSISLRRVFLFCTDCGRECEGLAGEGRGCTRSDCALQAALLSTETVGSGSVAECPLFRQCPNCQALLSHTGRGCPRVMCPQCGVLFCHSCQRRRCSGECITHDISDEDTGDEGISESDISESDSDEDGYGVIGAEDITVEDSDEGSDEHIGYELIGDEDIGAVGPSRAAPGVTNPADPICTVQ